MKDGSDCYKLVKMVMERNFAPVIIFSFSKKDCEGYALQMAKLDFNLAEEKQLVEEVIIFIIYEDLPVIVTNQPFDAHKLIKAILLPQTRVI